MTLRIVIADDALLIREGVRMVIDTIDGMEIVGEAETLPELMAAVAEHSPDVVITDIRMPPTNTDEGIQAARQIRAEHATTGVLVLSQHVESAFVLNLLEDGTDRLGYLLKENVGRRAELQRAIEAVHAGSSSIDPAVVEVLVQARSSATSPLDALTPRELEVLALIAEGINNQAIADRLVLSGKAVEKHINAIFSKLGLGEEPEAHRRVRSVLVFLANQ